MTGFGRSSGAISDRLFVSVTVKSVNHRFLEVSVRLPENLWELEPMIRAMAAERFARGKVDIVIRAQRTQQGDYNVRVNEQLASMVVPQIRRLAEELGLGGTFTGSDLMRVPDLLQVEPIDRDLQESEKERLGEIVAEAFQQIVAMREREGESLRADIAARSAALRQLRDQLTQRREELRAELLSAYQQRVQEIAASAGVEVSADRLAQETVLMVERGDIAEELTRLSHHFDELDQSLRGAEAAGKKLDFLSQEMLREINTIGSKSRSALIRSAVVEFKSEVERIREQVQNVE
ncbi:MAG TPA: YicC/YloC family endoribonuclease [Thermoanaerobaculia bacterium]|nr:YicC/YloC family endoribonuclease [Thermoanaerobaculia bacterium]